MKTKTLEQLWLENNGKAGFFVSSPTNKTSKYKLLTVLRTKNLAILSKRGTGCGWFKKYYTIFVLNNSRWGRV